MKSTSSGDLQLQPRTGDRFCSHLFPLGSQDTFLFGCWHSQLSLTSLHYPNFLATWAGALCDAIPQPSSARPGTQPHHVRLARPAGHLSSSQQRPPGASACSENEATEGSGDKILSSSIFS